MSLLSTKESLSEESMAYAISYIMDGKASHYEMADFLTALTERGETVDEIVGAARAIRARANIIKAPADAVDCCGTGGDGAHTYNISTAVALVAASCGIPVAKHGNRAATSKSGAADVLEALGVNLNITQQQAEDSLAQMNFAFLMAPRHHAAMKHVAEVRKALKFRTIFNVLGPLVNPANTKRQLIGVYKPDLLAKLAQALHRLGTESAWIVHGHDGLDEITVTGPTSIAVLKDEKITEETITPDAFGLGLHKAQDLTGGDATTNALALKELLSGKESAYRDIVIANTAAVLTIHDTKLALQNAAQTAAQAIDSGKALSILERYKDFTQGQAS